jgi:hypothetical protein
MLSMHHISQTTLCTLYLPYIIHRRGRIDFTTEADADACVSKGEISSSNISGGGSVSWIPSLADEMRDYVESIHAHSR